MTNMSMRQLFGWLSLAVIVICAYLLVLTFWGYGHISFKGLPADATVQVNGHVVSTNVPLKLRPGTYHISIVSPRYFSTYDSFRVSPFLTKPYTPRLTERTAASIANTTLGGRGLFGAPPAYSLQWLDAYSWAVLEVGPSTENVLAAHYENGRWQKVYITGDSNADQLPPDVATTVINKEAQINASLE